MTRKQLAAMYEALNKRAGIAEEESRKMERRSAQASNDLASTAMILYAHAAAYKAAMEVTPE